MLGTSATTSKQITTNYLNLLVTQLQHQNPLEPMDNNEMSAQLTQLSQLEQMEGMNRSFADVLATQQQTQAMELIGKQVTFTIPSTGESAQGVVEAVDVSSGKIMLQIGESQIEMQQVVGISQ